MKIKNLLIILSVPVLLYSCSSYKKIQVVALPKVIDTVSTKIKDTTVNNMIPETDNSKTDSFLANLLKEYPQYFDSILKNKKAWNVQVIYTQINRDKNNVPSFKDYYFNVDASKYFYPASTVKLPIALLALQKLNDLKDSRFT